MSELDRILATELQAWEASDLTRTLHAVDPVGSRHLGHAGGTWLNFASNDYLGLTRHPGVCEAAARAARDLGSGSGASRLVSGSLAIHHRLEEGLAHWMGTDKSLVYKLVAFHTLVIAVSNFLVTMPVEILGFKLTWAAFTFPLVIVATDLTVRLIGKAAGRATVTNEIGRASCRERVSFLV